MQDRYLSQVDDRILKYLLTTWWDDLAKRNVRDYNGFAQICLAYHKVMEPKQIRSGSVSEMTNLHKYGKSLWPSYRFWSETAVNHATIWCFFSRTCESVDEVLKCNHLLDTELPQACSEWALSSTRFTLFDVLFHAMNIGQLGVNWSVQDNRLGAKETKKGDRVVVKKKKKKKKKD